ncbi:sigma-70 family RNA polymerase sigma factor [Rhizobium leguminosarum]|uniref:sigma-70 family RNA polymerase sigma factor n=1 Tax=Rhizobium ruizarguesonis TaxID=2081791 RepID=UPI0013BAE4DE|nr:sigma-70 family RNA polymerase sigma factor [Rhizobium ruizarguesonis]NEJ08541.1 sigma-70 family RNA polymerase sigma factor [Rhizobium ruizarguesonis]
MDVPYSVASVSPLFRLALIKGEEASVLLHLRRQAPINGKDAHGRTPLMIAATNGRSGICELLMHEGADISLCDADGCTAFDLATKYGHHYLAATLQAKVAVLPALVDTAPADDADDANIEGWEAEEEFHAPANSRVADEDVFALQVAIASHRLTRERDDWETANISLPASTTERTTVAIPQTVRAMVASGLAAGWLTDDAVTAAWARARPEHIRQLRQLLAAANVRVFPARPGNPFQCISNAEPASRDLQLCQDVFDAFRDTCASRLDTAEKYKMEIADFEPFSPDREARIFGKVAEARARLVDAFTGFLQITPLALQGELPPTEEVVDDATEEADNESDVFETGDDVTSETGTGEPAAPELFLRDFIKLFDELEQKVSDRQDLESLRLALDNYRRARDRGMEGGLKLVPWLAYRYRRRGLPIEDLIQEGNIGLMRAVEKFDSTKGSRFGTYAVWWIRQAMLRAIEDQSRLIRVPVHIGEFVKKTERIRQRMKAGLGREASVEEIASELEVSPGKIRKVLAIPGAPFPAVSRSQVDVNIPLPDRRHDLANLCSLTSEMLLMLPARTERVLRLRFGMGGVEEHTLEEIGEKFDVTRERIRQIEAKGLRVLGHPNRSRKLEAFL